MVKWLIIALPLAANVCNALGAPTSATAPDFSEVEVITFDFYAALMDTEASLKENARPILAKDENGRNMTRKEVDDFVSAWAKQYSGYVGVVNALQRNEALEWDDKDLFKVMLNTTLQQSCMERHVVLRLDTKAALIESWKHLRPWQNTTRMLRALHAARTKDGQRRFRLAALSNADVEFLRGGCVDLEAEAGITFDAYLGCDGLGVGGVCLFKPEPAFYNQTKALVRNAGLSWQRKVLHVAGAQYDANGAKAFGLRTIWNANSTSPVFFDYTGTGKNVPEVILHEIGELPRVLGISDIPEVVV
jgi:FMN phosphatase YigB (HAD superfamily)